jgi:isorenieratene synthase
VVAQSPDLDDPGFRRSVAGLALTHPFAVWRLWLDRPADPGRKPFVGTTGVGCLDNISLYHLFEDESRSWVERHGGSVVELHAYAVDPGMSEAEVREDLLSAFHAFYPELEGARVVEERFLIRRDCPAFAPGSHADRPGVPTPHEGIALAGDFVRLPIPSALMERAVASGFLAANQLLAPEGVRPEPIRSIPRRGLLGWRATETAASRMR